MKKLIAFLLFAVAAMMSVGCAGNVYLTSTIPYHGTHITVLNNTDCSLSVIVDGGVAYKKIKRDGEKKKEVFLISPGETLRVSKRNWSGHGGQMSIAVTAYRGSHYVGAAARNYSVNGYYGQSQTWIISGHDIRR
jgi:archaellum component FlaG (FlaF/FlaG flagellin family)